MRLLIALTLIFLIAGCTDQAANRTETGRLVLAVTDASADMGQVSSVMITITGVELHNSIEGWTRVSINSTTLDLLKLQGENSNALLADVALSEGTYNQIRLNISEVTVTDVNGVQKATIPSSELKFAGDLKVAHNGTTSVIFDFIVNDSLHMTGKGEYILAPVIDVEVRENSDVEIISNKVEVKSGTLKIKSRIGMDHSGNIGAGLKISADDMLELNQGTLRVTGRAQAKSDSSKANGSGSLNISANISSRVDNISVGNANITTATKVKGSIY